MEFFANFPKNVWNLPALDTLLRYMIKKHHWVAYRIVELSDEFKVYIKKK